MKNRLPALATVIALVVMATVADAGTIFVYKDKDGVINLTDRPVPAGTPVQFYIPYEENLPTDQKQQQELDKQKHAAADQQEADRKIRELKEKAARASAEAEKEHALAQEQIKNTEAYLKRYRQKSRKLRQRYRQAAQSVIRDAEEAQARAKAAITLANLAQEELMEASAGQTGTAPDEKPDNRK
ncbi:MAG: DUF4124 domain-containing protein [Desulfobacterales bacterium]|nr:DUF4124 domain-containing protein [Desulfobacterales bacterium]